MATRNGGTLRERRIGAGTAGNGLRSILSAKILLVGCLLVGCLPVLGAADDELRKYAQGPLTRDDFRVEVPKSISVPGGGLRALAYTSTEMLFDYRYRVSRQDGVWTASLAEIRAMAVVWPARSWNRHPQDRKLLDHEQGHFDLAQMWALRGKVELSAAIPREEIQGQGETREEAVKAFEVALERRVQKFRDALGAADRNYDQLTRYGTLAEQQAAQRKSQRDAIMQLRP